MSDYETPHINKCKFNSVSCIIDLLCLIPVCVGAKASCVGALVPSESRQVTGQGA